MGCIPNHFRRTRSALHLPLEVNVNVSYLGCECRELWCIWNSPPSCRFIFSLFRTLFTILDVYTVSDVKRALFAVFCRHFVISECKKVHEWCLLHTAMLTSARVGTTSFLMVLICNSDHKRVSQKHAHLHVYLFIEKKCFCVLIFVHETAFLLLHKLTRYLIFFIYYLFSDKPPPSGQILIADW